MVGEYTIFLFHDIIATTTTAPTLCFQRRAISGADRAVSPGEGLARPSAVEARVFFLVFLELFFNISFFKIHQECIILTFFSNDLLDNRSFQIITINPPLRASPSSSSSSGLKWGSRPKSNTHSSQDRPLHGTYVRWKLGMLVRSETGNLISPRYA